MISIIHLYIIHRFQENFHLPVFCPYKHCGPAESLSYAFSPPILLTLFRRSEIIQLRAVRGWSILRGGSLLTQAHLCDQPHSATARHEHGAKRNANGTALTNPDSYLRFNMLPLNYTINRKSAHRHYGDGRCSILALKTSFFRNPATHGIYYL